MRYASTSVTERLRPSWQCTSAAPPAAAAAPMKRAAPSKKRSMSSSSTSRSGQRKHLRRAAPQNPFTHKPSHLHTGPCNPGPVCGTFTWQRCQ